MRRDKSQIPNPKSQKSSKSQIQNQRASTCFQIWCLGVFWDLGFGFWNFATRGFGIWSFAAPPEHGTRNTEHLPLLRHRLSDHPHPPRHHHLPGHHLAGRDEEQKGTVGVKADQTTAALAADAA